MVKLYIKDNATGRIHEYGTDQHDSLVLEKNGSVHYYNLQTGCGTQFEDEGYSFCLADGSDPRENSADSSFPDEAYLDIGGCLDIKDSAL